MRKQIPRYPSKPPAVHTKPFSTSVLQGLSGVFATTTKICTVGGSGQVHTLIRRYPSKPLWASMPQSTVDREKQRKSEIQTNPETRGKTPLRSIRRVHRALQLRPNDPLQLFFSSLTLAKQPRTIGRPVQRQPTGSVQCLISLYCTLLPHYAGKIELPACATYTAWITGATLRRRDAAVR